MGVNMSKIHVVVVEKEDLKPKSVEIVNCENELVQLLNSVQRVD